MINTVPEGRRNRGGKGVLPPNPHWWDCEHSALDLRRELGLTFGAPLSIEGAYERIPGARVVPHGALDAAAEFIEHYRGEGGTRWSGMALRLPDGSNLIVYNDSHPETRIRATLMEEFFHLRLGQPRSVVRQLCNGSHERTRDNAVERLAYGSGAASLVPFLSLREMFLSGVRSDEIAKHFRVSP